MMTKPKEEELKEYGKTQGNSRTGALLRQWTKKKKILTSQKT